MIKNAEKGDEVAISALIDLNKKDGIEPLAEHWVLTGALFGSKQLCKEYLVKYSGFNQDKKLRLFEVVTNEKEMIGANCLLQGMGDVPASHGADR
ncbi:hypothetical protein [Deefgea sp. CFH1-16]|uniref:hypothetical protein n=1 Tax=Deefgea sp. CFH1-16 TaxID=2675457 RepID=UPI0015F46464|nr:hypothetical protein [Deefgea sp. CFH1-16]MBM5575777.1 hypothetical protein [Deefgea sp. CFH1-16]